MLITIKYLSNYLSRICLYISFRHQLGRLFKIGSTHSSSARRDFASKFVDHHQFDEIDFWRNHSSLPWRHILEWKTDKARMLLTRETQDRGNSSTHDGKESSLRVVLNSLTSMFEARGICFILSMGWIVSWAPPETLLTSQVLTCTLHRILCCVHHQFRLFISVYPLLLLKLIKFFPERLPFV